jgi:hypothetical protein
MFPFNAFIYTQLQIKKADHDKKKNLKVICKNLAFFISKSSLSINLKNRVDIVSALVFSFFKEGYKNLVIVDDGNRRHV